MSEREREREREGEKKKKKKANRKSCKFFGTWTFSNRSRFNPSRELNPEF